MRNLRKWRLAKFDILHSKKEGGGRKKIQRFNNNNDDDDGSSFPDIWQDSVRENSRRSGSLELKFKFKMEQWENPR